MKSTGTEIWRKGGELVLNWFMGIRLGAFRKTGSPDGSAWDDAKQVGIHTVVEIAVGGGSAQNVPSLDWNLGESFDKHRGWISGGPVEPLRAAMTSGPGSSAGG
jgi:hypothetical protein